MSSMSTEDPPSQLQREFFTFYYNPHRSSTHLFPPLKEKYKAYRQQSYNATKQISDINYIKKFQDVCQYLCYVGGQRVERTDIVLIQNVIEEMYEDYQKFFEEGGWRIVKNKSMQCRLQECLLIKLTRAHQHYRSTGSLDKFVLSFFYTLNYFKTCNYQIRLFNEFLLCRFDLDYFFIFILLRKRSRRVNRDLVIRSQHVGVFVDIIKNEDRQTGFSPSHSLAPEDGEELGQIKLLLIYSEIIDFIQHNKIVLHEIMIYNLMKNIGLPDSSQIILPGQTDWLKFLNLYFEDLTQAGQPHYQQYLVQQLVESNLKIAKKLLAVSHTEVQVLPMEASRNTYNDSRNEVMNETVGQNEKFLQESFSYLISIVEGLFYEKEGINPKWQTMYGHLTTLYDYDLKLAKKLVREIFKDETYYKIYMKYAS